MWPFQVTTFYQELISMNNPFSAIVFGLAAGFAASGAILMQLNKSAVAECKRVPDHSLVSYTSIFEYRHCMPNKFILD